MPDKERESRFTIFDELTFEVEDGLPEIPTLPPGRDAVLFNVPMSDVVIPAFDVYFADFRTFGAKNPIEIIVGHSVPKVKVTCS